MKGCLCCVLQLLICEVFGSEINLFQFGLAHMGSLLLFVFDMLCLDSILGVSSNRNYSIDDCLSCFLLCFFGFVLFLFPSALLPVLFLPFTSGFLDVCFFHFELDFSCMGSCSVQRISKNVYLKF